MAYALTSAGARLNIGTSSSLAFDKDSIFTIAGNFLFPTLDNGAVCQLFNKQDNAGNATGWSFAYLHQVNAGTPGVGNWISLIKRNSAANQAWANIPFTATTNTWNHFAASTESASTNDFKIYANGTQGTNQITGNNLTSAITNAIVPQINGRNGANNLGTFSASEVGIWNAALTAAEIASLAKGMTCDKVRPQSLVFYAPLVRNLQDARGGLAITNNGGATVTTHPRVYA